MKNGGYEDTLIAALGIKVIEIKDTQIVATMPINNSTRQPMGLLHGGASAALAETVAGLGTYHFINPEIEYAVGIEINANHVRKKRDGVVTAVGKLLHHGKTIMVWDIKITDEQENLICVSRCTIGVFPKK
ncbi:PaaI family thioesterase [Anaerosinus massiliensis]|uniref:PaaI family thioesterase n=1 Tax=Massilibacillus massiliensis TaxID=1806837 RepID=UPI000DA5F920|nr:PaaI family thioesterase [Massilibacillus massiliensis]